MIFFFFLSFSLMFYHVLSFSFYFSFFFSFFLSFFFFFFLFFFFFFLYRPIPKCCCCFGVFLEQDVCPPLQVLIVHRAAQPLRLIELINCVMSSYTLLHQTSLKAPANPKRRPAQQGHRTQCQHCNCNTADISTDNPRHLSRTQQVSQQPCPGAAPVEAQDLWHWHTTICSPAVGTC